MKLEVAGHETYVYTGSRAYDGRLPSVVFLHGAGNDHSVWTLPARYFAHHGANALAFDLPGHGRSRGAPLASVEAIADWTVEALDVLRVPSAAWVGHSMGSLAALDAAARHAARVERLALLAPGVPMPVSAELLAAAAANDSLAITLITGWAFSPSHQLGGSQQPGMWMTGNGARLLERARPGVLHTGLKACAGYARGLAAAAAVRCPVLLLAGGRDVMVPYRHTVALAAALERKEFSTLASCSHSLMSEDPDAVLDALRAFIDPAMRGAAAVGGARALVARL